MPRPAARALALFVVTAAVAWTASPASASPALSANPTSVDFGNGDIHSQNQNGPFTRVTLTNDSAGAVSIQSIALAGSNPDSFQLDANNNCGGGLSSGQSAKCRCASRQGTLGCGPRTSW